MIEEAHRVLKPGGALHLWYLTMGEPLEETHGLILPLEMDVPAGLIQTGYGVKWNRKQDEDSFVALGKRVGFQVKKTALNGETGRICFAKEAKGKQECGNAAT